MPSRSSLALLAALATAALLPAQLAGAYTVGAGGSFANLGAAIAALQSNGVAAPVVFVVLGNETGPWSLGAFPGQGPANPVVFDGLGTAVISGTQPVLALNGCASVTFRGLRGTFVNTANGFTVNAGTTDCAFVGCDFRATVATGGSALFNFTGGSGCRIEDSTFGGGWESMAVAQANDGTTVQRCRILGGGFRIMTIGGTNFTLANNFITGNSNYGINGGMPGQSASAAGLKIWHNAVFITHPTAGSQYCSLRWYSAAPGTEVVNNIFVDMYPTLTTTTFNVWCSGALRPGLMNHNCFFSNQAGLVPFFASGNQTLAQWQAQGFDANSFQADPLFVAPTAAVPDLSLQPASPCAATGTLLLPVLTDFFQAPRTPPVSIGADEEDGGPTASYTVFGVGCPGAAGVPSNTASAPPRPGQNSTVMFGNLPSPELAIALLGLSSTFSPFGPLPLLLTPFGAPGCEARVSPDATIFLLGAGGVAGFVMSVPNQAGLLGVTFHTQALVLQNGVNALGATISDAATAVVGV